MPLYSYRCTVCEAEFEALVSASEEPVCPTCGATSLERLISSGTGIGGRSASLLRTARSAAAKEGHFSNYKKSEISKK